VKATARRSRGAAPRPGGSPPLAAEAGITAAVLQDHALAWAVLAAFTAWLAHDLVIAWINRNSTGGKDDPGASHRKR
jgi:hypothetical protein